MASNVPGLAAGAEVQAKEEEKFGPGGMSVTQALAALVAAEKAAAGNAAAVKSGK
jgi:hypothetical protein